MIFDDFAFCVFRNFAQTVTVDRDKSTIFEVAKGLSLNDVSPCKR